jgi:flavin-dependent dehydrogenase
MKTNYDIIIIGAGPAGTTAACKFMQEGLSVKILEKMQFPRFVIGESLLPHCMDYLHELDLLKCVEELNFQVKSGACFYHDNELCDFRFDNQYTDGWKYTYQVKRAEFDHALAKETEKKGANVEYKAEVLDVKTGPEIQTVKYKNQDGVENTLTCKFVVDASGYGRVLPRMFDLEVPVSSPPRGAIFAHVKDEDRTEIAGNNIFVNSFNNNTAWIWSIPFSDGTTSVGIVADVQFIEECAAEDGKKYKELVSSFPGLENRYANSEYIFEPRKILNYSVSVKQLYGEGFILCGNSTEFLDPVFSSGVTLAISSGYKAAKIVSEYLRGEQVDFMDYSTDLKKGIDVFRSYVNAWYDGTLQNIFYSSDTKEDFRKQICSVLAGYVWDESNPFVKKHATLLTTLNKVMHIVPPKKA